MRARVRAAALLALARVGEAELAVPYLASCLLDDDAQVQACSWRALLAAGDAGWAVARGLILDRETSSRVLRSIDALGEEASSVRAALLFDSSWMVRRALVVHCERIPELDGAESAGLYECACHDRSSAVRLPAITVLGPRVDGNEMAAGALRASRDDPDPRIRLAVLRAVPAISRLFDEFVRAGIDDPHPALVTHALLRLRGRAAAYRDLLLERLASGHTGIATAAAIVLAEDGYREPPVPTTLLAALGRAQFDGPWERRNLRAGGAAAPRQVPVPNTANPAVQVLIDQAHFAVMPILEHARDEEPRVRRNCVLALAHIGEPARGALTELVDDADAEVAATARRALAWLDAPSSGEE